MTLMVENTKSMIDSKKELIQNELKMKKLKRILEISSVICSTASINIVIACVYGFIPDIFGFKSQEMIFDLIFSLLVASVVLGILAMATSRIPDRKLKVSFPALGISTLFSSLLTTLRCCKNNDITDYVKLSEPVNSLPALNHMKSIQFGLEQMKKKSQLVPLQQTFMTNGLFNEVNTRNISDKYPQIGIVSPFKINSSHEAEYRDQSKNLSPSDKITHTSQKHLEEKFNPNSLAEQRRFYQNTGRMSNVCFKDYTIPYERSEPVETFQKFPRSQREMFNNRWHTTHQQNLHEMQSKLQAVRCHNSREIRYKKLLQTIPESYDELSDKTLGTRKFNLHKMQEVDSEEHCNKFRLKVTPNFLHPLRDLKEAIHPQIGTITPHYDWKINSAERGENFVNRFDIPMEICDKAPNDQVLEVSMKLNNLNFKF